MTPAFTVILPHKRNPGNDAALKICLSCLYDNTRAEFKLISDAAYDQPLYARVNRMVAQADTDPCVYLASDTFLAPGWDEPMLEAFDPLTFVTGVLVEPGAIGIYHLNLHHDFGRTPEQFDRAGFEAWTQAEAPMLDGEGWYCPYMFSAYRYQELGGLSSQRHPDGYGFTAADIDLFEYHKQQGGRVVRVRSYAYHLQRWSDVDEQMHSKRSGQ